MVKKSHSKVSEEICSVPEQHCADKSRTGRRFFTCPNFYCCPKGVVTCTMANASELIHGNCELIFMSMRSLASNIRHCCRKEHVRESKDLKVTLSCHESSHNMLTLSKIPWSLSEEVFTVKAKPFKCLVLETLLRWQANPSYPTQLLRSEEKLGQSQALYSLISSKHSEIILRCEQLL